MPDNSVMKEENFNKLTPAELERLAILLEELGEAQQIVGKILRHGFESTHPDGGESNRELLQNELGDIDFALELMFYHGDLSSVEIEEAMRSKGNRIRKYLHHNEVPHV